MFITFCYRQDRAQSLTRTSRPEFVFIICSERATNKDKTAKGELQTSNLSKKQTNSLAHASNIFDAFL